MSEQIKVGPSSCCVCGGEYGEHQNWCSQSKPKVSDKINDGGPAFSAMSLRDYFAGQAMLGLLTQHIKHSDKEMHGDIQYDHVLEPVFTPSWIAIGGEPMESESIYSCACDAYAIADAMLAARKESPRE